MIASASDFGLSLQGWVGRGELNGERVKPPSPTDRPVPKPQAGFFTSSWDTARSSTSWLDLMQAKREREVNEHQVWTLTPMTDTTLFVIDSWDDYRYLSDMYPKLWDDPQVRSPECQPNWHEIGGPEGLDVDGIHATEAAIRAGREPTIKAHLDFEVWACSWEIESTLWFRVSFAETTCVGAVREDWSFAPR